MHSAATASDAFARWETLEPPSSTTTTAAAATTSTATTPWSSPSPPFSLGSTAAPSTAAVASKQQRQLQPPPTPNISADVSFAFDRGGRSSAARAPPRPPEYARHASNEVEAATDSGNPGDDPGRTGTFDSRTERNGASGREMPSSSPPHPLPTIENGITEKALAVSPPAAGPPPPTLPRQREEAQQLPAGSHGGKQRDSGGFGSDETEALLARLAGKAKQAAAAALSASAASGTGARFLSETQPPYSKPPPPPLPPPLTPQRGDGVPIARCKRTPGAVVRGNGNPASAAIDPTARTMEGRRPDVNARRGARREAGSSAGVPTAKEGRHGPGAAVTAAVAAAAVAGARAGGARLAELCKEDKAKVARLMQDLVKLREEKGGQKARLERLRAQNESIVKEVASLKVKFGQSMQLLRKYQSILQEGGAAGGGAAAATSAEMEALRETLRAAEESARKAEEEAAAERASRSVMAEELRRAKQEADALLQERNQLLLEKNSLPNTGKDFPDASLGTGAASVSAAARGNNPSIGTPSDPPAEPAVSTLNGPAMMREVGTAAPAAAGSSRLEVLPAEANTAKVRSKGENIGDGVVGVGEPPAPGASVGAVVEDDASSEGGGGGGGAAPATGSSEPFKRRRPRLEEAKGGVASGAELAAVKEQMETLKQQLVMVGVQQLALTGIPTRDALLGRQGDGCRTFHNPAVATAGPSAIDGLPSWPSGGERGVSGRDGGRIVGPTAAETFSDLARAESDRSQSANAPPRPLRPRQQQLLPPEIADLGSDRRGREESYGAQGGYPGGSAEVPAGGPRRRRDWPGRATGWSGGDGGGARAVGAEGEGEERERDVGAGEFVGTGGSFDEEERVGWWARSTDELPMAASGDGPGRGNHREGQASSGQQGRAGSGGGGGGGVRSSACTGISTPVPAGSACDGLDCDRNDCCSTHDDDAQPSRRRPPLPPPPPPPPPPTAPVFEPADGFHPERARHLRGEAWWRGDASAGSISGDATAAGAGATGTGKLRVSWSSVSAWSSESDLSRGPGPAASSASSTDKHGSASGGGFGSGGRSVRRRGGETSGAVPRKVQKHQQQVGSAYDRVSPSSFSSSAVSSSTLGRHKWAAAGSAPAAPDAAALDRRLRTEAPRASSVGRDRHAVIVAHATGSTATASVGGNHHPRLKTRATTTVPGSRRRVSVPPPAAAAGSNASALQPAAAATTASGKTGKLPVAGAIVSGSGRRGPAPAAVPSSAIPASPPKMGGFVIARGCGGPEHLAAAVASGVGMSGRSARVNGRESAGRRRRVDNGDPAGQAAPSGLWKAAVAPERARRPASSGAMTGAGKAAGHGLGHKSGYDGSGVGPPEKDRRNNRANGAIALYGDDDDANDAGDDDTDEALATLGGESFFDGSLLDLIDDLEELDTATAATGQVPPRQAKGESMAAAWSEAIPQRRRTSASQSESKCRPVLHERVGQVRAPEVADTRGRDRGGHRTGGDFWGYGAEEENGDY